MAQKRFKDWVRSFLRDDSGATAVEYALLISILSIGVLFSLDSVGNEIANDFTELGDTIERQDLNTGHVD